MVNVKPQKKPLKISRIPFGYVIECRDIDGKVIWIDIGMKQLLTSNPFGCLVVVLCHLSHVLSYFIGDFSVRIGTCLRAELTLLAKLLTAI